MRFLMIKVPMLLLIPLFVMSVSSLQAETTIYLWVDKHGKSHFSDTAEPGTEQIIVENKNLMPVNTNQPTIKKLSEVDDLSLDRKKAINYQAEIISPQDDMAIRSNDGALDIHVKTTPEKESSQRLQLFLDAEPLGTPQLSPTMRAFNVDRGTHQVQVHLLDETGKTLAKTQIVTIHLKRAALK